MIAFAFDPVVLVVAGVILGLLVRFRLAARNEDYYPVLWGGIVALFWVRFVAAVAGHPVAVLPTATVATPIAVLYALAYPFWIRLGAKFVFLLVGRHPQEGGVLWVYVIDDYTADFGSQWE